jgi:ribonuclease P protein component
VTVLFLPEAGVGAEGGVRVAYSVGRRLGTAVERNRVRRRLRAAMRDVSRDGDGLRPGAYLVLVRPEAGTTPYPELKRSLGEACAAAARGTGS